MGRVDAELFHVSRRGHAGLGAERACERALGHSGALGEAADRQVVVELGRQLGDEGAEARVARRRGAQLRAELRLAAAPPHEHHEPRGHGVGELGTVVVSDECEGEIHPGGDAGRGPHPPVVHVDRVGLDVHRGPALGEPPRKCPVGRRALPVELARRGEDGGAGAHGRDPGGDAAESCDLGDERGVVDCSAHSAAARDDERVEFGDVAERRVDTEADAALRADVGAAGGREDDLVGGVLVGLGRGVEHLERSERVEGLDAVADHDHDAVRTHGVHGHPSDRLAAMTRS